MSYQVKTPWHRVAGATFVTEVRDALVKAFLEEKRSRNIKQVDIARALDVDRAVIHRQLTGAADLSLMRAGEIAAILGRDVRFVLSPRQSDRGANISNLTAQNSGAGIVTVQSSPDYSSSPARSFNFQGVNP